MSNTNTTTTSVMNQRRSVQDQATVAYEDHRRADLDWAVFVATGERPRRPDLDWAVAVAFEEVR